MPIIQTDQPAPRKPLRLWPGVVAATLLVLLRFVVPIVVPDAALVGFMGGLVCAVAVVMWWLFFSRAPWTDRLGAIAVMFIAFYATRIAVHESIRGGMMGMMVGLYAIPISLPVAFVAWAIVSRRLSIGLRRASMVLAILLGCGVWTLVRTDGTKGAGAQLHWRWTPTAEQRLLASAAAEPLPPPPEPAAAEAPNEGPAAKADDKPVASAPTPAAATSAAAAPSAPARAIAMAATPVRWAGFRGRDRNGVVPGVRIATDWSATPPVQLWRRPIGPGWSSFAVAGDFVYTQEQRGDVEIVACYDATTGRPVWMHRDAVRFWESNGGAGPRATPTLSNGRVYTLGATGIVNALDASRGTVVWSRNASADTGVKVPVWGFAGSPLVVGDVVIVAASGALAAYEVATGAPRWSRTSEGGGYSSPHLATIDGVAQVVLMGGAGATSVAPSDGTLLWQHAWAGVPIVQPAQIAGGDFLITTADAMGGIGMRRIAVAQGSAGWNVEERWTSRGLKPYFSDFVVHEGHAIGFDGTILACIDLEDGTRKWKGGRYGSGQLVLLADQDLLLVLSEDGELALVSAISDRFTELARVPAIEGKTWNHPVLVGDVLLVRNGQEMAAFRLPLTGR